MGARPQPAMANVRSAAGAAKAARVVGLALLLVLAPLPAAGSTPDDPDSSAAASDSASPASSPADAASARAADFYRRGDLGGAAEGWREAAELFALEGRASERISALIRSSEAQQGLGQYQEAIRTLTAAMQAGGDDASKAQQAAIHGALGNAWIAMGPVSRAAEHLERAIALAREADAPAVLAPILLNLGNLRVSDGRFDDAFAAYEESARTARKIDRPDVVARALANAASAGLRAGVDAPKIREQLVGARAATGELPDSHDKAYLLINLARSHRRLADPSHGGSRPASAADLEGAYGSLVEARRITESLGDPLAGSYANGYLGELYEMRGRYEGALQLTRRGGGRGPAPAPAPESIYRWEWQVGRVLAVLGQNEAAIEAYQRAVETLQGIRYEMAHTYAGEGGSFRQAVGPVFFELVDLLLRTAPDPAKVAAFQARLQQVQALLEEMKAAELRDYFQDECVDALQAKVESLDAVTTSAVVIYPIILADRIELLLNLPSGMRRVTVPVAGDVFEAEARALRRLLEKRTTAEYLPHAQQLYRWLVGPIEQDLAAASADTLVFVPDGALRLVPMAALHDGERFLIERYAIAITPGLTLTDPRPLDPTNLKILLSGLSESVAGLAPLAYVPSELASIQDLYGGLVLLDEDFRLDTMEKTLAEQEFNVVHIASHGEFSADGESSYLQAYDGRMTMDRLSDYVGFFRFRDTPIELLTLSACETAQGNDRAALGLAGVAIRAGARSALGTLWSVNDAAAAQLVVEFYRQLGAPSTSKATALQRAQQKMLSKTDYGHPFYWSPFLLISNWL